MLMIVDAHCHIVEQIRGRIGRGCVRDAGHGSVRLDDGTILEVMPSKAEAIRFTADDLLQAMDRAGVRLAMLLQGPFYGEANDEVAKAVYGNPGRFRGAAYLDPWRGDGLAAFDHVTQQLGLKCIKLELSHDFGLMGLHPELDLGSEAVEWLWDACQRSGVVVTIDLGQLDGPAYQLPALEKIAMNHPSLRIVIPHLGNPRQGMESAPERLARWNHLLRIVRDQANMSMDISALPHRCIEPHPYQIIRQWVEHAVERVGADCLMWGTDVPGLFSLGCYEELLALGRFHLAGLTARDRQAILGENALGVYWPCLETS